MVKISAPCKGCDYLGLSTLTCDYYLRHGVGNRRPCKPGKGCRAKTTVSAKGKLDRDERLLRLYQEGKNDVELARATGYHIGSIRNWRKRHKYPPVVMGNPLHKKKKEGQT